MNYLKNDEVLPFYGGFPLLELRLRATAFHLRPVLTD